MKTPKDIKTIRGELPGKTIAIVAGIHGNEKGALKALELALDSFHITNGVVHFVIGNPLAIKQGVRFVESNLNRAFKPNQHIESPTYEQKRARELMSLFDTCDALLDLHSVSNPKATPFIICEKKYFDIAKKFPFPIRSSGWNKIEPGGTDFYMSTQDKIGICLECGYHDDPKVTERALEGIKIFLGIMGNSSFPVPQDNDQQKEINATEIYITKENFVLADEFSDFTYAPAGKLIGHDGNNEYRMPSDGIVIFARATDKPGQEAVIISA